MRPHDIEGGQVADTFVKFGRASEVGEQEGQAGDLQPLVDIERVGAVEVAERLVGQQALGGEEGAAAAEHAVQGVAGDADAGQHARIGAVLQRDAQRSGPHLQRLVVHVLAVEGERQALPLARRLALDVDELAPWVTGSKMMTNSAGSWIDSTAFSPGANSTWSMRNSSASSS